MGSDFDCISITRKQLKFRILLLATMRKEQLVQGNHEAADWCRVAKRAAVLVVADAKTWVWEEFGEAM